MTMGLNRNQMDLCFLRLWGQLSLLTLALYLILTNQLELALTKKQEEVVVVEESAACQEAVVALVKIKRNSS